MTPGGGGFVKKRGVEKNIDIMFALPKLREKLNKAPIKTPLAIRASDVGFGEGTGPDSGNQERRLEREKDSTYLRWNPKP